jgi:proline dehydrogenase
MEIPPDIFENTEVAFAGKTDGDLQKAKALFTVFANPSLVNLGSRLADISLKLRLPVSPLFKWTIYNHFCGGETFDECKITIRELANSNIGVLLNYGVELKETDADFDKALQKNIEAVEFAHHNNMVKGICIKPTGYGRFELFEKVQQKAGLTDDEQAEYEKVKARFKEVCEAAVKFNVPLYIDAEESWIQDALDTLVESLMEHFNRDKCIVYNTLQFYRWDRLAYLDGQVKKAKAKGYQYGAKIVRGAYMEKERKRAVENGYKSPIHNTKLDVDKDFDDAIKLCLDNREQVFTCIASQSEGSCYLAIRYMEQQQVPRDTPKVIFSQLYGMGDNITYNLARLGFITAKYLPYGPVKDVIPYLIRRAEENTSVAGQTGRELALVNREIKRRKSVDCV